MIIIRFLQLILVAFIVLSGCLSPQEEDASYIEDLESKAPQIEVTESESLNFSLKFGESNRNSNRVSPGSFGDIVAMRISVEQVAPRSGRVINHQTLQFNQNANSSTTT